MKLLVVGEFDPCGVHLRQRKYLREAGVDYRLAVHDVYREEGHAAEWWINGRTTGTPDYDSLREFAESADIVVFLPSISQVWSHHDTVLRTPERDIYRPFGPIEWGKLEIAGRRVACFHGSLNAAANMEAYAALYRGAGFAIAATTLDYVHGMDACYMPSIVDLLNVEPAALREDNERLRVVHAPTNRVLCSTSAFLETVNQVGKVIVTVLSDMGHEECLAVKRRGHAGYDHVRGSFSINSLENAALGLVNLVAVKERYRGWLLENYGIALPWPRAETMDDIGEIVRALRDDAEYTRDQQSLARTWYESQWHPRTIADHVLKAYAGM